MVNNKLIVIDGLIGAGKSTLIEVIKNKINNDNVLFVSEPIDKYMEYKQFSPLKLAYENPKNWSITQLHIINCLTNTFSEINKKNKDKIIISERGLFSPLIFSNVTNELNYMTDFELCFIIDYLYDKINILNLPITGLFYIDISIDKALERIKIRNREGEDKITETYLKTLDKHYKLYLSKHEYDFPIKIVKYNDPKLIDKLVNFLNHVT